MNNLKKPDAILIAGPTASGKSAMAIDLAQKLNGSIINTDSMQTYDVLSCLTARPRFEDMADIPHFLFGYVKPGESYSVATWLKDAENCLNKITASGRVPIFVGGTGLYFKALLEGLANVPEIDPDIRNKLRNESINELPQLYHLLLSLDPKAAEKIKDNDAQRIVRALEVVQSTGKTLSWWHSQGNVGNILGDKQCQKIVLEPPKFTLHERIEKRFETMVEDGAIHEVEKLLKFNLPTDSPVMRAIGVSQLKQVIENELDLQEAIKLAVIATRQYAKRQSTWFRHQFDQEWVRVTNSEGIELSF